MPREDHPKPQPKGSSPRPGLERALREESAFHKAVLDAAVLGIITIDREGKILAVNPAAERLFGWSRSELLGHHVGVLMGAKEASEHDGYVDRYVRTREARIIGIGREIEAKRKDGSTFPAELSVSEIALEGGRFFTGLIHDITDRKRAEAELRRHLEELDETVKRRTAELSTANTELEKKSAALAESNRELERFAGVVAHDLRNPLSSMTMFLTVLQKLQSEGRTGEAADYVDLAIETSGQMRRLITDVLDYAKLTHIHGERESIDCNVLLLEITQSLDASIRQANATVVWRDLPTIHAHRAELSRVLQNLLGNAVTYGASNNAHVQVTCEPRDDAWVFAVADNGPGIDPEHHATVFQPFQRLHNDSEALGHGLGLAICHKLVTSRGGEIDFASTPGEGARFWFTVPRKPLSR